MIVANPTKEALNLLINFTHSKLDLPVVITSSIIKTLLPFLEPKDMPLDDKEEIFEFMKKAKDVSMRTFVKAAGFKNAGLKNWERMSKRYL